jgi:hypothetical protein
MVSPKYQAIRFLKNKPKSLTYKDIRNATSIPSGWISMLAQERIKSPDAKRLETLINFFNELDATESKS